MLVMLRVVCRSGVAKLLRSWVTMPSVLPVLLWSWVTMLVMRRLLFRSWVTMQVMQSVHSSSGAVSVLMLSLSARRLGRGAVYLWAHLGRHFRLRLPLVRVGFRLVPARWYTFQLGWTRSNRALSNLSDARSARRTEFVIVYVLMVGFQVLVFLAERWRRWRPGGRRRLAEQGRRLAVQAWSRRVRWCPWRRAAVLQLQVLPCLQLFLEGDWPRRVTRPCPPGDLEGPMSGS